MMGPPVQKPTRRKRVRAQKTKRPNKPKVVPSKKQRKLPGAKKRKRSRAGSTTDSSSDELDCDLDVPSGEMPEDDPEEYVGMSILKFFEEDGDDGKWHKGEVKNTDDDEDTKWPLWGILYEDGGYEDLSWSELTAALHHKKPVMGSDSDGDDVPLASILKPSPKANKI